MQGKCKKSNKTASSSALASQHYLNLCFNVLDRVRGLDLESDGLASESLHKYLHPTPQSEDKVQGTLLLDVVVREGASVLQLLASKDETLLVRRNTLLVLSS